MVHLAIGINQCWRCWANDEDVGQFWVSLTGYMIVHTEHCLVTNIDATDSIALSTCDVCHTIQLLCCTHSPPEIPHWLLRNKPLSLSDLRHISDRTNGGLWIIHREYLHVGVYWYHWEFIENYLITFLKGIEMHKMKLNHDGLHRLQPTCSNIWFGIISSLFNIQQYCWTSLWLVLVR